MRTLRFILGAASATVEVTDPTAAEAVAGLFRPLLVDEEEVGPEPDLVIESAGGTWRLRASGPEGVPSVRRFRSLPNLLADVEFALVSLLLRGERHRTHLHAAGAVVEGGAVLAVGDAAAGKSSLALAWSLSGHPILADDIVLADADGRVTGVPRLMKVTREVLGIHGLSAEETVAPQRRSPELWWDPARGGGWHTGPAVPKVLARVRWSAGAPLRIERLSPAQGLGVLLDNVLGGGSSPRESVDRLVKMAESTTVVTMRFGSSADAASALVSLAAGYGA